MFHKKWCGSSGLPRFRIFRKSFLVQSIPQFRPFGLLTRFITASSLRRTRDLHARKKNRTENDRNFHNNELMKLNCSNSRQRLFAEANGMMYRLASSFPFFFSLFRSKMFSFSENLMLVAIADIAFTTRFRH